MKRKTFLAALPLIGLSALLHRESKSGMSLSGYGIPAGLQLYSLQDRLTGSRTDIRRILEKVADIGVKELETASGDRGIYYGFKPREFARIVADLGMTWIGNHVGGIPRAEHMNTPKAARSNLKSNLSAILDEAAEGGCSWVVCSGSAVSSMDEIRATTELFANVAQQAGKRGMRFAYHNHKREFEKVADTTPFKYIMENTLSTEVYMQLDLGWAVMAGIDPVDLFRQYPGRFPLWHIKDFSAVTRKPCVIGQGIVGFKRIFQHACLSGVKHAFIEQDDAKSVRELAEGIKWLQEEV